MDEYKTVSQGATDSFVEKHSKFIGYCRPVKTEEEALEFIASVKSKHWDASHNVYAYIIREGGAMRYSDDGEPQGTAGIPVLDVLRKSGLSDVCVVATRYFGGILLGGGGLVRAYSHTASIAVAAAVPVLMKSCSIYKLRCDYNRFTKATEYIGNLGGSCDNTEYDDAVNITFHIPPENADSLFEKLGDLTGGKAEISEMGEAYFKIVK